MPPPYGGGRGASDIQAWLTGPAVQWRGSRPIPTAANGAVAFGQSFLWVFTSSGPVGEQKAHPDQNMTGRHGDTRPAGALDHLPEQESDGHAEHRPMDPGPP